MPSVLDREILTRDQDAFGHRHFADALRSLIESESLSPPFSIGLLGGWGSGKSTIKSLYLTELGDDQTGRRKRFHTVTFNAWRYSDNVKRALLRQVYLAIGGNEEKLNQKLFGQTQRTELKARQLKNMFLDMLASWSLPLIVVLVILVVLFLISWAFFSLLGISSETSKTVISSLVVGLGSVLIAQVRGGTLRTTQPVTRIELPTATAEQYQDLLLAQLREFKAGVVGDAHSKSCERLVVFVDDLDRLSSEEMVQGLDAVRTFMEIPESDLPNDLGLVFVISCDEERVAHALERGRRHSELPASVFSRFDARRYLDRIFQFRLEIPPFPRRDMRQFAFEKLRGLQLPGLDEALEAIVEKMIHVGVHSPRNALQIVNTFAQSWWIAHRREHSEAGTSNPGALHEGAVTRHPLSLAALCAIRSDFPDFYADLQRQDDLIRRFVDVVFRNAQFSQLPQHSRDTLSQYLEGDSPGNPPTDGFINVRSNYRPLRQYLATLQSHRWPKSIRPLLLLSQDAVSRRYGDGRQLVYDSLVSGDLAGVLEGLGRDADTNTLRSDDVLLLRDMTEDLAAESDPRRVAATSVLASLVDRLPGDRASLLLGPLSRQLEDSRQSRWRLGISLLERVLGAAEPESRTAIASSLVRDALSDDDSSAIQLKSGELASLEEAIAITKSTVSCVLSVRADCGLDHSADKILRQWLLERPVRSGEKEHHELPFEDLHSWMQDHSSHLVPLLGADLGDILVSEFEANSVDEAKTVDVLSWLTQAWSGLHERGEESRAIAWTQLARLAMVKNPEAVRHTWETADKHRTRATAASFSTYIDALCTRIANEMADGEKWPLDWKSGAQAALQLVESRSEELSEDARASLQALVLSWSEVTETANYAARGMSSLPEMHRNAVVDDWAPKLLDGLPLECIDFVAEGYELTTDNQRTAIGEQLQSIVAPTSISEEKAKSYRRFVEKTPPSAWKLAPLQSHINALLPQLAARHNNPDRYLSRIFPAASQLLRFATPDLLGTTLHTLLTNAKSQRAYFSWLHDWMATRWPTQESAQAPYDPVQLFDEAYEFATAYPQDCTKGVLRSMQDMLARGLVSAEKRALLVAAACAIWRHGPTKALSALLALDSPPSAEQTADLADAISWDEENSDVSLKEVWRHIIGLQNREQRRDTIRLITAKGVLGSSDRALTLWIDLSEDPAELLQDAIRDGEHNDAGHRRLWLQAVRIRQSLSPEFFTDALEHVLLLPDHEETARAVLDSAQDLGLTFDTHARKNHLADILLREVFPRAPTSTVKGGVAAWAKAIGSGATIKKIDPDTLSSDDAAILEEHFGKSPIKRIRKAIEKRADES